MMNMKKILKSLLASLLIFSIQTNLSAKKEYTVEEILNAYIESNDGMENIESVRSIRIIGKTEGTDGNEYDFVLMKKRPDLMRMSIRYEMIEYHMGYDGKNTWKSLANPKREQTAEMNDAESEQFLRDTQFESPLVNSKEKGLEISYLGTEKVKGVNCHVLKVEGKSTHDNHLVYLHLTEFRETLLKRTNEVRGKTQVSETYFSGYQKNHGIWFAYRVETQVDGETISKMNIDSVDVNVGVMNSYFKKPRS